MGLNHSEKKFLKKNLKELTLAEAAQKLEVEENQIKDYLKSIWSKEKYQRFMDKKRRQEGSLRDWTSSLEVSKNPLQYKKFWQNWSVLVFLAFLVFAVYANSLGNEFVSDDIQAIQEEENIARPFFWLKNQPLNFFRYGFYFLAYKIGGLRPAPFRLLGLLFHLGSVWLVYALMILLFNPFLAITVASLFAVHPLLSEPVVWISGGVHGQYTFFVLLSFFFYIKARLLKANKRYYVASLLSFFVALFTSEKSAVLALIIVAFELSMDRLKKNWRKAIPYFLLAGVCAFLVFFGGFFQRRVDILESQYFRDKGLYNPLEQIPTSLASYLKLIFWPDKLTLYHSEMSFTLIQYSINLLITLVLLGGIVYGFFKKKYRAYFFWLSFFLISLLPMLTPFKVAWIVAERYVYLGSLGIFVVLGLILQRVGQLIDRQKIIYATLGIILLVLSARTVIRNRDWKNQGTLWLAAARTSPSSAQNHNNLGDFYGRQGDLQRAVEEFKTAIALRPDYADAYHNLANTYQQMGKTKEAIENYQKALLNQPQLWQSHQNLAAIYFSQGDFEASLEELEKAVAINPDEASLKANLGIVYLKLGEKEKAQEFFKKALELQPENERLRELLNL